MKKKILLLSVFILFILLFDRLFTYIIFEYNHLFFSSSNFETKLTEHLNGNEYNAILMGSSRTYEGIHPDLIKSEELKPFKWSFAGFGPKYNYYFYKLYKKSYKTPEVIMIGVDYFVYSLFSSPSALAELNRGPGHRFNLNYLDPSILLLKNKKNINIILRDIVGSFSHAEDSPIRDIEKIQLYTGAEKSESPDYTVHTDKNKKFMGSAFIEPPGSEGDYFIRLLEELKDDEVKVILIVIPEFIGTFRTNKFKRTFKKHLKKLKRTYNNIIVLNYNTLRKFNLGDDTLFLDGGYGYTNSHLSKKGSGIFNRMLRSDLKRLGY
ncbi:MAG: hypothetical protein ABFR36_02300 [Acidobacteriota bacterium]